MRQKRAVVIILMIMGIITVGVIVYNKIKGPEIGVSKTQTQIVFAHAMDATTLDPAYIDNNNSNRVASNIYEGLVRFKSGSVEVEPCLATNWDISQDKLQYTFHLRRGIEFHDGTEFNADSVLYGLNRLLPSTSSSQNMPYANFIFGRVKAIEKVDDFTVKFTLEEPFAPFLSNLAMVCGASIISETALKRNGVRIAENPSGTGPFKFKKWDKNGHIIILESNKKYWGNKSNIDRLVIKVIKDDQSRTNELRKGYIDIIDISGYIPDSNNGKKMNIVNKEGLFSLYLSFNCQKAPFNNKNVREAVIRSIDAYKITASIPQTGKYATTLLPSMVLGYNKDIKPLGFNIEKSKEVLKGTNLQNLNVKVVANKNINENFVKQIQESLSSIGIKSTVEVCETGDYLYKRKKGNLDLSIDGWQGDNGDPDNFFMLFESSKIGTPLNGARYLNPTVDELIKNGRETFNNNDISKIYQKVEEILAQDEPFMPISHGIITIAYSQRLQGVEIDPWGDINFVGIKKSK